MYFIGVDVGTASVRAAIVSETGAVIVSHSAPIEILNVHAEMYEQSTRNIWDQCCLCIRKCLESCQSIVQPKDIHAIGFDATCSLVVLDSHGKPLPVSSGSKCDIIMWMDHRAHVETEMINETHDKVLDNVGGRISIEMQMPKLMWLKKNMPSTWSNIGYLFDLPDYLTARACHDDFSLSDIQRSLCSAVCKWAYQADSGFSEPFLSSIGLDDLLSKNEGKALGKSFSYPGYPIGTVSKQFASDTGLSPQTLVATSLIDAYSGDLGTLGIAMNIEHAMALISGTSSCHICLSDREVFVDGVWGPFKHALLPNLYCLEAGQSAAGKLIDHVIQTHPSYELAKRNADSQKVSVYEYLNEQVKSLANGNDPTLVARNYHMTPDYHGNRSPLALAQMRGCTIGESLDTSEPNLAVKYCSTLLSIAYGTRHILRHLKQEGGVEIKELVISGGLCKNELFIKFHADVCQLPVIIPAENQYSVLIGSAILAATAYEIHENQLGTTELGSVMKTAMKRMSSASHTIVPSTANDIAQYHDRKYDIFMKLLSLARESI